MESLRGKKIQKMIEWLARRIFSWTRTKEQIISGSYNGRRAVSETDNEGPIPSPGA